MDTDPYASILAEQQQLRADLAALLARLNEVATQIAAILARFDQGRNGRES